MKEFFIVIGISLSIIIGFIGFVALMHFLVWCAPWTVFVFLFLVICGIVNMVRKYNREYNSHV